MPRYNPKEELKVLLTIKELGEATVPEIQSYLKDKWETEIDQKQLIRLIRRWKKRKIVSANSVDHKWVYSLRDIPYLPEAQMIHVIKPDVSKVEAREFLENYEQEVKERGYVSKRTPDYSDFQTFKVTMETIDRVAGGMPSEEKNVLVFPRKNNGEPYIPINWLQGWHRDNFALINIPKAVARYHIGLSTGEFAEKPEVKRSTQVGARGPCMYETIGAGNKFSFVINLPRHGCQIKTQRTLENFYKKLEVAPIRGLGAYPAAFGGRTKLLSIEKVN